MPLQAREFVGTLDAPPATAREELRSILRVWPNTLRAFSTKFEMASVSTRSGATHSAQRASLVSGSFTSGSRRRRTHGRASGPTRSDRRGDSPCATTTLSVGMPTQAFANTRHCSRVTSASRRVSALLSYCLLDSGVTQPVSRAKNEAANRSCSIKPVSEWVVGYDWANAVATSPSSAAVRSP